MQETFIDWSLPGNYILPSIIIGLILFGLLIVNFIMIYLKYSKKDSDKIDAEKNKHENRGFLNQLPKNKSRK